MTPFSQISHSFLEERWEEDRGKNPPLYENGSSKNRFIWLSLKIQYIITESLLLCQVHAGYRTHSPSTGARDIDSFTTVSQVYDGDVQGENGAQRKECWNILGEWKRVTPFNLYSLCLVWDLSICISTKFQVMLIFSICWFERTLKIISSFFFLLLLVTTMQNCLSRRHEKKKALRRKGSKGIIMIRHWKQTSSFLCVLLELV